ncbi:MAG: hypothetical protein FWF41_00510 [Betaproteobacteria bacterium]|nr:hypothetical protein [Betaproteobacteria bacterium]
MITFLKMFGKDARTPKRHAEGTLERIGALPEIKPQLNGLTQEFLTFRLTKRAGVGFLHLPYPMNLAGFALSYVPDSKGRFSNRPYVLIPVLHLPVTRAWATMRP